MRDGQNTQALGTFERRGEDLDLRFERIYPRPPETVWNALTEPERLRDWMGVSHVEPGAGGRIDLMIGGVQPMTGRILIWDPPRIFEFSWSNADTQNSVVRYELIREGASTRMIFTQKGIPYARSGLVLPGWHTFFTLLGSVLDGVPTPRAPHSWREMQRVYVDHYQLRGVLLDVPKSNG